MKLPYCSRCNQPRTPDQLRRGICGACRRHRCEKHQPGSIGCYCRHGCRCDACCAAHSRSCKRATVGLSRMVPDVGARRRLQALSAIGWRFKDLGDELGINPRNLQRVRAGRAGGHIQRATAQRIVDLYDRLSMKPPPDSRYARERRTKARGYGWLPPLAWDDGTGPHGIDNPAATPHPMIDGFRKPAEMAAELRHIIDTDTPENIALRLGYASLASLSKTLDRIGEHALARRIDQGRRAA